MFEKQKEGARILIKKVDAPERFGVVEFKGDKIAGIEEKPDIPKSDFAVTGVYMYDSKVFDFIRGLKPSDRGELEITDVNNMYIEKDQLEHSILDGWWTDAGTFDSLMKANILAAEINDSKL
jgi:glucose-1-phosphate thymidylyltransferase